VTTKASFAIERLDSERVVLTDLNAEDMLVRVAGLQNETPALKAAIAKLTALVQDMNKARAQRSQFEAEREKIVSDQERVRSNLQSVGQASDLGRRYLTTLKTQEDRLGEIEKLDAALEKEIEAKTKAAEDVVRQLTL
jgi:predicted  nucleic acid-binding Zn-ribbon protein